jgi:hypothetical protein
MEETVELPLNLTPHEDIAACTNALNALSEFDYGMMDEEEKEIYRQIKLMALYIIHIGVKEIYTANFMEKKIHQVVHRKLGKEQAYGIAYTDENKMEIDERLRGYRYLLYLLHEHFHLKHPDWSESKVRKESSKTARFLWQMGFRLVELK